MGEGLRRITGETKIHNTKIGGWMQRDTVRPVRHPSCFHRLPALPAKWRARPS
jgi:hypothetical protein